MKNKIGCVTTEQKVCSQYTGGNRYGSEICTKPGSWRTTYQNLFCGEEYLPQRSTDRFLFYRRCRIRYGIVDNRDLAPPENRQWVLVLAAEYGWTYSVERLGRMLDRLRPKYEALRRDI